MILEGTHLFLVLPRHRSLTNLSAEAADVLPALAGRRLAPSTERLLMDLEAYFLASRRLTTPLPLTHASRCPRWPQVGALWPGPVFWMLFLFTGVAVILPLILLMVIFFKQPLSRCSLLASV